MGYFPRIRYLVNVLKDWKILSFEYIMGCVSHIATLEKGGLIWIFNSTREVNTIL